jgi:Leucine Rich repeat
MAAPADGRVPDWRAELERVVREGERELDLRDMPLGGDGGIVEIAEGLRGSTAVTAVSLVRCAVGDGGAVALAEILLRGDTTGHEGESGGGIKELTLSHNSIGLEGVEALADALKKNTTLEHLGLSGNPGLDPSVKNGSRADAGVEALISAIGVNTTLSGLSGAHAMAHRIAINKALRDSEGRRRGKERFLAGPSTKAARASSNE